MDGRWYAQKGFILSSKFGSSAMSFVHALKKLTRLGTLLQKETKRNNKNKK